MMAGDHSDEAIQLLRDAIEFAGETRPDWDAYLNASLAFLLMNNNEMVEAHAIARVAFAVLPTDDLAGAVFATTSIALGKESEFIDAVDGAVAIGLPDPVFTSPENRLVVERSVATARARLGDVEVAWEAVQQWRAEGITFEEPTWAAVAEVACRRFAGMDLLEAVLPLVAEQESSDGLLGSAAPLITPDVTVLLAVGLLSTSPATASTVTTGLAAAMVTSRWDLFDEIVTFVGLVDDRTRVHLAERLETKGQSGRASQLRDGVGGTSGAMVARFGAAGV